MSMTTGNLVGIVYNATYGGFGISGRALEVGTAKTGDPDWFDTFMSRNDKTLVHVVEVLGPKVNDEYADLAVRYLPTGTKYRISECDGLEYVVTFDEDEWEVAL